MQELSFGLCNYNTTIKLTKILQKKSISENQFFIGSFCAMQKIVTKQNRFIINHVEQRLQIDVPLETKILFFLKSIIVPEQKKKIVEFIYEFPDDELNLNNIKISIKNVNNEFNISYYYNPEIYSDKRIAILNSHWVTFINSFLEFPNSKIKDISIVSDFEKKVISKVNNTDEEYSKNLCVHERFSETARQFPDEVAIEYRGKYLTFKEVEFESNKLANYLVSLGVVKNDFVGIMIPRGIDLIISMLAVMKSGATYIPLSKDIPFERISVMLQSSQVQTVITTEKVELNPSIFQVNLSSIDLTHFSSNSPINHTTPEDNVALIFTSGSTGTPKGVLVKHNTVVNYCEFNLSETNLFEGSHVVQFAPFIFSTMIYEVMTTLFSGSRLHLVDENVVKDVREFQDYIFKHPINFLLLPSQYVNYIQIPDSINSIETGASNCLPDTSDKINLSATHLHAYGLTEGSIVCVWKRSKDIENGSLKKVPIGQPVYNTKAYVLNESGQEVGMYMPGELCVTGVAVSNGYHNMPELTSEKFVKNPFGSGTMLKTGDIVEWNYYGELEYVGRIDNQIKIRGMRVELEEIEYQIGLNDSIISTAVIVKKDIYNENYLVAFVVGKTQINIENLKKELSRNMLSYMVPNFIKQISQMPLNSNGKIDKKKLENITLEEDMGTNSPTSEIEKKLVHIFSSILGRDKIRIEDSFFDLGGHSLTASKLLNEIEKEFNVRLTFADIFKLKTIKKIGQEIENHTKNQFAPIIPVKAANYYPLSPAQNRMYFVNELDAESNLYHLSYIVAIKGKLDYEKLSFAFQQLVDRNEIFRTNFKVVDNEPIQIIRDDVKVNVEYIKAPHLKVESDLKAFNRFFHLFNLANDTLIRLSYLEVENEETVLIFDMHHIISDGMSLNLLIQEISDLYNGNTLESVSIHYKDYAAWINSQINSKEALYWKKEFCEEIPLLKFPTDYPRPNNQSFKGKTLYSSISNQQKNKLKAIAKETNSTEYMIFLTTLMILLSKYSMQDEIVIGSPVSGRIHNDTEKMFGLFINSLALKGKPISTKTVNQFLSEIRQTCLNAYENQLYPFEKLVDEVGVPRTLGRHPLFDVMLVVQNNENVELNFNDVDAKIILPEETTAQYDLTFSISETPEGYSFSINYATELFRDETIDYLEKHFQVVLVQLLDNLEIKISDIETVTPEEELLIKNVFNNTKREYDKQKNVVELIEEQVKKTPNKQILFFENEVLTYKELNVKANQLAHYLTGIGVKRNDFVVLHTVRSVEMFIAILGVLKAGAAYIPVNIHLPEKRITYILDSIEPKAILKYQTTLFSGKYNVVDLDTFIFDDFESYNPFISIDNEDPIYGIYTSGTTGNPKCVVIQHKNISNYCQNYTHDMNLFEIENPSLISVSEYSFDIFATDCLFALANSIIVYLTNELQAMDPNEFMKLFQFSQAKILGTTPSKFKYLTSQNTDVKCFSNLEFISLGGEKTPNDFYDYLKKFYKGRLLNAYGPSETTITSTCKEISSSDITIGKPISNYQVYIQNSNLLAGIGVLGEIVIAGDGVGLGYRGQKELTSEKFIDNPYGDGKLYLSGDLGRWLPSGEVEIFGRIDNQIKLRGYRIELDEVEEAIRRQKNVSDAVAVIQPDHFGEDLIVGYFMSNVHEDLESMRANLEEELPDYMVPTYLIQLENLPINSNGKLDVKSLPKISLDLKKEKTPLTNETEEEVAKIFKEVLGFEELGSNSNFFELGGNSLRLTSVSNFIEEEFGVRLKLQDIYTRPTVSGVSKLIETATKKEIENEPIVEISKKSSYQMSSTEQRQFVVNQMDDTSIAYNMPSLLKMDTSIDILHLQKVIDQLLERHEILRTSFSIEDGIPVQIVNDNISIPIVEFPTESELEDNYEQELLSKFVKPFNLSKAPLIRLGITTSKEGTTYILVDNHHIISDGESTKIMLREIFDLYRNSGENHSTNSVQYKDYSEWMNKRDFSMQKEYWKNELSGEIPVVDIPLDYARPLQQSFEGETIVCKIDNTVRNEVERLSQERGVTSFMTLLSVFMILLGQQSYQENVIVGSPVSGRTNYRIKDTIGMFVNNLVLKANVNKNKYFDELLDEVKKTVLGAIENQDLPYEKLIGLLESDIQLNRNPLFDIMFVYQNDEELDHQLEKLHISNMVTIDSVAKFDLSFTVAEKEKGYTISFNYATSLFTKKSMTYFMNHFCQLLMNIVENPRKKIGGYSSLDIDEKKLITDVFNYTTDDTFLGNNSNELFKAQVEKYKTKTALVFGKEKISYEELNDKVELLARNLIQHEVSKGDFVGIICSRSVEMIIGILGIIRVGAAYVPIDPDLPIQRINSMLSDANPKIVLGNLTEDIQIEGSYFDINQLLNNKFDIEPINFPLIKQSDIAYILYTSGTTGNPKGVLVKQEGIVNLQLYFKKELNIDENDNILQFANVAFDASVWEMTMALLNGATLHLVDSELISDVNMISNYIKNNISVATFPPQYAAQLPVGELNLRLLITAGSSAIKEVVEKVSDSTRYINAYGPSETTICATSWENKTNNLEEIIPIGKPISNSQSYIMDENNLVGIGVPGELCIAGKNVSLGYLNLPDKTSSSFVQNPFGSGKLYRTGDLARYRPDGNIEYFGRIDRQIKLRGFRIELLEIEDTIRRYEGVSDAAVIARGSRSEEKQIVGYVVINHDNKFYPDNIKDFLEHYLPNYMIPSQIIQIDSIPITPNGKLDENLLPIVENDLSINYEKPDTQLEEIMVLIFEDVLNIKPVGVTTDFFDLDGDSIKAIRIISKLREKNIKLTVKTILQNRTIRKIAREAENVDSVNAHDQGLVTGSFSLTPIQKYFFEQNYAYPEHFNQSMLMECSKFESAKYIKEALIRIVMHHDGLRTIFNNNAQTILGIENEKQLFSFLTVDLTNSRDEQNEIDRLINKNDEIQEQMDIERGPLISAVYYQGISKNYLLICIHHLIIDGVSWRILFEDFSFLYSQLKAGVEVTLPKKTASMKEWSEFLNIYAKSDELYNEYGYWKQVLLSSESLPIHMNSLEKMDSYYESISMELTQETTEQLIFEANKTYNTKISDLLIVALSRTIYKVRGFESIDIQVEGHGRESVENSDFMIDRTVGWLTSIYPIITENYNNLEQDIINMKEMIRKVPNHGFGFNVLKYSSDYQLPTVTPKIGFNHLGDVGQYNLDKDSFSISKISTGKTIAPENKMDTPILLTTKIEDGELVLEVRYDSELFSEDEVARYLKLYKEELLCIIEFCLSKDEQIKTLSDIGVTDLDSEDLDMLNSILDDL